MKIGINLLWLKPKKMGGVEFFVRYLLKSFKAIEVAERFVVFINSKAYEYCLNEWEFFKHYKVIVKNVDPFNPMLILLYQWFMMKKLTKEYNIDLLYHPTPIYPIKRIKGIKQIVTFHDLQFLHFPHYASCLLYTSPSHFISTISFKEIITGRLHPKTFW